MQFLECTVIARTTRSRGLARSRDSCAGALRLSTQTCKIVHVGRCSYAAPHVCEVRSKGHALTVLMCVGEMSVCMYGACWGGDGRQTIVE